MSIGKWSTFVRLNFSSRTWKRHLREAFIAMEQFQKLLSSENFLKTFSTSIMSTVFINTNANSNNSINSNGSNGALRASTSGSELKFHTVTPKEIEGKNHPESRNFRKVSVISKVIGVEYKLDGPTGLTKRCKRSTKVGGRKGSNWTVFRYQCERS